MANRGLNPEQFYLVKALEAKAKEFETHNLAGLQGQLNQINQQRELVIQQINQVSGAITAASIIIAEELEKAGVTREDYEEQKSYLATESKKSEGNIIQFPAKEAELEPEEHIDDSMFLTNEDEAYKVGRGDKSRE